MKAPNQHNNKRVHWDETIVWHEREASQKIKRSKKLTPEEEKLKNEHAQEFKKKVLDAFEHSRHKDLDASMQDVFYKYNRHVLAARELHGDNSSQVAAKIKQVVSKALSVDNYFLFTWCAVNNNIDGLQFIIKWTVDQDLQFILKKATTAVDLFLFNQCCLLKREEYDERKCIEGLKIFLMLDSTLFQKEFEASRFVKEFTKDALATALLELEEQEEISASQTSASPESQDSADIQNYAVDQQGENDAEEYNMSNSSSDAPDLSPGGDEIKDHSAEAPDQQSAAIDSLGNEQQLNHEQEQSFSHTADNKQDASAAENLFMIIKSWIKDWPELFQQYILSLFNAQQLLKILEAGTNPDQFIHSQLNDQPLEERFKAEYQKYYGQDNPTSDSQEHAQVNQDDYSFDDADITSSGEVLIDPLQKHDINFGLPYPFDGIVS